MIVHQTFVPTRRPSRGMGSLLDMCPTWKIDSSGNWVDCCQWSQIFNGSCWNPSNPQLAGPGALDPNAPMNPITDAAIGVVTPVETGTGQQLNATDYIMGYLQNPSNFLWIAIAVVGGIIFVKWVL